MRKSAPLFFTMKHTTLLFFSLLFINSLLFSQQKTKSSTVWQAMLKRADGKTINFNFEEKKVNNKPFIVILNAAERLKVENIDWKNDSVFIKMPVFESSFSAKISGNNWNGLWTRGSASKDFTMPFEAKKSSVRYELTNGVAKHNISGRWAVKLSSDTGKAATSIGEFVQRGNIVSGTFLTPTGDYRYLQGVVTGNQLLLSGFDGGHAVLFEATVGNDGMMKGGNFYSGPKYSEQWSAVKNAKATVKINESAMYVRPGEQRLNFRFPDLDSNLVSIGDDRFKNKVVVIQLMGSWCPNCMDETSFLSGFYAKNKKRGVEMVALAYEYSTDFNRSKNSLLKFKKRFNVEYPVLITGVTVSDSMRTEKTLPQVTRIKVFPSSIILDRKGNIHKLDNGFVGPATGSHYEEYKREFYKMIDELLYEK